MKMKKTYLSAVAVLVCAAIVGGIAGMSFYTKRHFQEDIVTGPNVTESFGSRSDFSEHPEKQKRANVSASSSASVFFIKNPPYGSKPILFPQKYRF